MRVSSYRPLFVVLVSLAVMPQGHAGDPSPSYITVTANGDGVVDDSLCTLREAILAANAQDSAHGCQFRTGAAPTRIEFDVAGFGVTTFDVNTRLPAISVPVVIDGLTQPGADCTSWPPTLLIQISNPTHGDYNGLTLDPGSDGSSVRGLIINGFSSNQGVEYNFNAAINILNSDGNTVECNFLGTDASGTSALSNLRGVDISSASSNVIGSDGTAKAYVARNLISGNLYGQVDTRGNALSGNRISGNFIGVDVTGTQAIGAQSGADGVAISANPGPATGNFVGWDGLGDPALMRNVISGFTGSSRSGVKMVVGAQRNVVAGNYIGTDVTGTQAIPNFYGVSLGSNASVYHNFIGSDGVMDLSTARNVISGNSFAGIDINGANGTRDNAVIGNYIGMNANGTATLANDDFGLTMAYASANTLVAGNWFAGQPTAIRFFASGSFGGGSSASFINNAGGANPDLPPLDSSGNCVLGTTGVLVQASGASVPSPNLFEINWWGAAGGPNSSGASTAHGSIDATPYLTTPAAICSDVIFRNGFEA